MSSVNKWQRRSRAVSGHVAFPVDDPAYEYVPEGGLFVRLVVEPRDDEDLLICAGGWNTVNYDEEWFSDDTDTPVPARTAMTACPKTPAAPISTAGARPPLSRICTTRNRNRDNTGFSIHTNPCHIWQF